MKPIYHIVKRSDWEQAKLAGAYRAASLESEGFIHASYADQIVGSANKHYRGAQDLILLVIDAGKVKAKLQDDPVKLPDGGQTFFPHIYGPLNPDAVVKTVDFPVRADGTFMLPAL